MLPFDAAARAPFLGAVVVHASHGHGEVVEVLDNGAARVRFDSGDEHTYQPRSLHKLASAARPVVGAAVRHPSRGPGTVTKYAEGCVEVQFAEVAEKLFQGRLVAGAAGFDAAVGTEQRGGSCVGPRPVNRLFCAPKVVRAPLAGVHQTLNVGLHSPFHFVRGELADPLLLGVMPMPVPLG